MGGFLSANCALKLFTKFFRRKQQIVFCGYKLHSTLIFFKIYANKKRNIMDIQNDKIFEFVDEYLQRKYNSAIKKLITQLIEHEDDPLTSIYSGFESIDFPNKYNVCVRIFEDFLGLRIYDQGTFITGDSVINDYSFIPAKGIGCEPCFALSDNTFVTSFSGYGDTMCLYPLNIRFVDEDFEDSNIMVEIKPCRYMEYDRESFYNLLQSNSFVKCKIISYFDYLKSLIGEEGFQQITDKIEEWNKKASYLRKLPLSKLRKKNKELFIELLYKNLLIDEYKISLNEHEKEIVINYLTTCPHHSEISKMIYTFAYTLKLFEKEKQFNDYLDLTFILVSAFKVVEVTFSDLLKSRFGKIKIIDSNKNEIDFSNEKLTLGSMKQFFYADNEEIKSFLAKRQTLKEETLEILNRWIKKSRNGFLHKDIVQVSNTEQLNKSITDSIQLLCNLIILFNKD